MARTTKKELQERIKVLEEEVSATHSSLADAMADLGVADAARSRAAEQAKKEEHEALEYLAITGIQESFIRHLRAINQSLEEYAERLEDHLCANHRISFNPE